MIAAALNTLSAWLALWPWVAIDNGLQMASALAWLGVSHRFAGSVWRILYGEGRPRDAAGAWACFTGISQIMFTLRWLWLGTSDMHAMSVLSLQVWAVCYVSSTACAVGLLHTLHDRAETVPYLDADADARARGGLIIWLATVLSCISLAWLIS